MRKRRIALFLSLIMVLSVFPMAVFASEFTDMPDNWSRVALEKAVANGLLKGDNGKIRGEDNLTRAEMATIVNRAFQSSKISSLKAFKDLAPGDWYYQEMGKAVGMGIFKGTGDKLNPEKNITREEAFLVLARAFKISELKKGVLDKFSDKDSISTWAKDGVSALVSADYIAGSNGKIKPKEDITRAEFAQIMDNLLKTYITKAGQYTENYKGNVMINKAGVTLKGNTLDGDLIIGDGVGDGEITLDGVTVKGRLVVRGGGENSIRIIGNSSVKNITIARVDGKVRVYSEDGVEIGEVTIDGNDDVILEGDFEGVTILSDDIKVFVVNANVELITSLGENVTVVVDENSTIDNVVVNGENTTIEGEGDVKKVSANGNNTAVNTKGTDVKAGQGATGVTARGEKVEYDESEELDEGTPPADVPTPPAGGGGGGGGGTTPPPTVTPVSSISVDKEVIVLAIGARETLVATVLPSNATNKTVTWTSSNEDVATVEGGVVTAVTKGEVEITAKAGNYTAICEVNVVEITVDALDNYYYPAGATLTFDIKGLVEGENKAGILIHTGEGEFPWVSDVEVIDGLEQSEEGLYYTGNTIVNGSVTLRVSGEVQLGLPAGNLWITLPDYGIGIDNAIELKDVDNNSVHVGPMVGTNENYEYQSIQAAIDAATEGDIIEVVAGTYNENITINKSIVLRGDPGDPDTVGPGPNAPIIDGESLIGNGFTIASGVVDVVIEGFKIIHFSQKSGEAAKTGNAVQAYDGGTANITIRNNYMFDLGYNGILVGNNSSTISSNWTINNNYIEKHRLSAVELINTGNSTVQGNAIQGGGVNASWNPTFKSLFAIVIKTFSQELDNITIEGNQIDGFNYYNLGLCNLYANNGKLSFVSIINNQISSAGSNPDMKFEAVSSGTITDTTVSGNTLNTFKMTDNVVIDLNVVLDGNEFPDGSQVIGNEIKLPD